jgi:hypothetical protein
MWNVGVHFIFLCMGIKKRKEKEKDEQFTKKNSLEPKTCFGHNKSSLTHIQMKFKGYVHSDEA